MDKNQYGHFIVMCAHRDGDYFGRGKGKKCTKPATNSMYGMDRCDKHVSDLDPKKWVEDVS